jgi:predicted DCC family thiol-disulfide oxidoreductase YuxK
MDATRVTRRWRMTQEADSCEALEAMIARPLILFDGVCNLCNAWVRWVVERDKQGVFRLASLQSEAARRALADARPSVSAAQLPDGVVLMDEDRLYTQSDAALRVARRLGLPYSLLALAILVPRPVRDALYRFVARNRYRWFGRRSVCMTPTPELAARFLDADEPRAVVPESPSVRPTGPPRPG